MRVTYLMFLIMTVIICQFSQNMKITMMTYNILKPKLSILLVKIRKIIKLTITVLLKVGVIVIRITWNIYISYCLSLFRFA